MKLKVALTGLLCIIIIGFSSCSGKYNNAVREEEPPEVFKTGFSCDADVRYGDMDISIALTRPSIQECIIEVTDPSPIKGLKLHWVGQDLKMSYMGLSLDLINEMFPDTSFATAINNTLGSIAGAQSLQMSEQDGKMTFSGNSDSGEYSVTMNMQTGQLENLKVPSLDLDIDFTSFSAY